MKEESPRFLEGYVCISSRGRPLPLDLELYSRVSQKVLEMIEKTLTLIDAEEADDDKYHAWCDTEQTENEDMKTEKETNLQTLETTISELEIALQSTKDSIDTGRSDFRKPPILRS